MYVMLACHPRTGWCDKIHGSTIPINHARPNRNLCITKRDPIGVVGLVVVCSMRAMRARVETCAVTNQAHDLMHSRMFCACSHGIILS